jgi:hypothetical protein
MAWPGKAGLTTGMTRWMLQKVTHLCSYCDHFFEAPSMVSRACEIRCPACTAATLTSVTMSEDEVQDRLRGMQT